MNANDTYAAKVAEARKLLAQIAEKIDRHAAEQAKDRGNWGYVGDMGAIVRELSEVAR